MRKVGNARAKLGLGGNVLCESSKSTLRLCFVLARPELI